MFSTLKQDSVIYILEKNDTPRLTVASVTRISSPYAKVPGTYMQNDMLVDIEAFGGGTGYSFKKVPAAVNRYEEGGAFITDSRDTMQAEVEAMLANSRNIIDSIEYHKRVVESCGEMLPTLDPSIAEEREREKRMSTLEDGMREMRGVMDDILTILKKQKQ